MKIAFVFDGMGYGGIERIGTDYVKMGKALGYEIDVYNLNPKANDMVRVLSEGVNYFPVNYPREKCPELYSYGIQKWWWGKYAYAAVAPILTLAQCVRKLVSRRRTYDVAIAISGHINDLSFVAKNFVKSKRKIVWCHGNLISYLAICDAYSILYKKVDKIVTLSSAAEKDVYLGRKYLYEKEIIKIYNPTYILNNRINLDIVRELKDKYQDFMLMIARADFRKGYDTAIATIKKLKERGMNKKLVFAGDGESLDEYKKLALDEGVADNCIFVGNQADVQNYIYASYINILTSRGEGLPTVIVEAMTIGKPCVMTNSDDGEVSGNGRYCPLIAVDDVNGLADAIYGLYTDQNQYDYYSKMSLERASDFRPERIREQFKTLVETDAKLAKRN